MKKMLLKTGLMISILLVLGTNLYAQAQRNPVLEECTGTWCQWCPCGHDVMEDILATMPNAIMIGYHGPSGSSDPWDDFPGNQIIGLMSFSGYPTAVIDRTGAPMSRSAWTNAMNQRYNVPATVTITMDKNYNKITRELVTDVHVTPLTDLTGTYNVTMILLEDGLVYPQTGNGSCPGATDYVHNHVVRAIINGAEGEQLNTTSPWTTGNTITKNITYTIPPGIEADSSRLAVLVSKVSSPFYTSEIQQAEQWTLVSPDYVAVMTSQSPSIISENSTPGQFTIYLHNMGLLDDTYTIDPVLDAPAGWTAEYTTVNGTFPFGQTDSVFVSSGDSTEILVTINPNGFSGFGTATVNYSSNNDPGLVGEIELNFVTTTGVDILVVDASTEGYGSEVTNALDNVFSGTYGVVNSSALEDPSVDLSNFVMISWSAGIDLPVFVPQQVSALESYLDNGGRLFINGQDIGADIFEPTGQSQFAQSFYNNYLHADYVSNSSTSFLLKGVPGDPVTDGVQFVAGFVYDKSLDMIEPYDGDASSILTYLSGPNIGGIKAATSDYRVVYSAAGIEQIDQAEIKDTLMSRIVDWLLEGVMVSVDNDEFGVYTYSLDQNYPNPFNPSTKIKYSLERESDVNITVYDVMGREVADLLNERKPAGVYEVDFDASQLSSGVYIYKITAGDFVSSRKMILMK